MATVDATCPKVLNMLVLDSDGRRLGVKYFSPEWWVWGAHPLAVSVAVAGHGDLTRCPACRATVNSQANYEKAVFAKTSRTNARQEGVLVPSSDSGASPAIAHVHCAADASPVCTICCLVWVMHTQLRSSCLMTT